VNLTLRLASGSGRAAVVRQALVVAGIAVASALLLVAVGVAHLQRTALAISGYAELDLSGNVVHQNPGSNGAITLAYLVEPGLRRGVVFGFVLCVVPLLVFVATASRVASRQRDERLAGLRLAGASTGQVRALAVVDTLVGGTAGVIVGTLGYLAVRALLLAAPGTQAAAIAAGTTPPIWLACLVLLALLAALGLTAALALRSVLVSPLGVARRAGHQHPRPLGLGLLGLGLALALAVAAVAGAGLDRDPAGHHPALMIASLVLLLVGLVVSGPWLSVCVGRLVTRRASTPALLLAGRRLEDDPRAQARAMSAVVLVVVAATIGLTVFADALAVSGSDTGTDRTFIYQGYGAAAVGMLFSLLVGASGLLLATGEGLLERRRSDAALHAAGVPLSVLRRSVLLQVALPVLPATVLAVLVTTVFDLVVFGSYVVSVPGLLALTLPLPATGAAVLAATGTLPLLRGALDVQRLRVP
jgi:uncharacterized membrane protein YhaH (DUF805 family)